MNILLFTVVDLSIYGAERNHVSEVANGLAALGHRVYLVGVGLGDLALHSNVRFHPIPQPSVRKGLFLVSRALQDFTARRLIRRLVAGDGVDVIYFRQGRDTGLEEGLRLGVPVVVEVNSIVAEEDRSNGALESDILKGEEALLGKFKRASRLLALTQEVADYYAARGVPRQRLSVVPLGVNLQRFRPLDRGHCRLRLGLGDYPLVCHVGSFRPYQGIEDAIRAWPLVLQAAPEARMAIVGSEGEHPELGFHPTRQELEELARAEGVAGSIIFTGKVGEEQVVEYMNASDVLLTLRTLKCGPNTMKLLEYLACGRPVVGSLPSGMAGLLHGNNCGIAVDPENRQEVAAAVVRLLQTPSLRAEMGLRARQLMEKEYTWEAIAVKIEGVLQEAVAEKGSGHSSLFVESGNR